VFAATRTARNSRCQSPRAWYRQPERTP